MLHKCYTVEVPCDKSYTRRGGSFVEALFTLASLRTYGCTGANASRLVCRISRGKILIFTPVWLTIIIILFASFFFDNISQSRIIDEPVPYRTKSNVCAFVCVCVCVCVVECEKLCFLGERKTLWLKRRI